MKNTDCSKMLDYWRNNLADAARVEIPVEKSLHVKKAGIDPVQGSVDIQQANHLIDEAEIKLNALKGLEDKEDPDWQHIEQLSVLITFFYVSPIPEHAKYTGETGTFYPFWIKALMDRSGALHTDEETFPYIPRPYLEPQINEEVNFTFSDIEQVDNAFARIFTGEGWPEYWEYVHSLFQTITGLSIQQYEVSGFRTIYEP